MLTLETLPRLLMDLPSDVRSRTQVTCQCGCTVEITGLPGYRLTRHQIERLRKAARESLCTFHEMATTSAR
jgi:hypothetical protein